MSIFRRRKPDPLEAPSPAERRRSEQASAHLAHTLADSEGEAYDVPQPRPSWPDVAPDQDRFCFACKVRCCAGRCWKCGRPTHLRSLPAVPRGQDAPASRRDPSPGVAAPRFPDGSAAAGRGSSSDLPGSSSRAAVSGGARVTAGPARDGATTNGGV